ncbi:MAG: DUF362 domain-containing protein [Methanotrichaceae archaeon]|nr:DUF362 domain-containing protein [Methanotrichaceae archaeon]
MPSRVFFSPFRLDRSHQSTISKIRRLFDASGLGDLVKKIDLAAIKLHFGERGCDFYLNPVYVRQVVDKVKARGGEPFLVDANTLYSGSGNNAVDHLTTAIEHGFGYSVTGALLIIADGLRGEDHGEMEIEKKDFPKVKVAGELLRADTMIVMTHFNGHVMAGFGGAIKNLAMGCAPVAGKMDQHRGLMPAIDEKRCKGCGSCAEICRAEAIQIRAGRASIDHNRCTGCVDCQTACQKDAIDLNWERDIPSFMEMMTEYAFGAALGKRIGYLNFLINITPDCDCMPWSDSPIVPNIGILASTDPVAIDKASLDLVNREAGLKKTRLSRNLEPGEEKYQGVWRKTDGERQITYGEEIGLGKSSYELVELSSA